MKSKCHIFHIFWTNYIFWELKTLCYIKFKNWYYNCTIIFPKESFVQEIWEMWHFNFMSCVWQMTLQSVKLSKYSILQIFLSPRTIQLSQKFFVSPVDVRVFNFIIESKWIYPQSQTVLRFDSSGTKKDRIVGLFWDLE